MKIGEYIELVKQADFNSSYSAGDAFAGKPQPPAIPFVGAPQEPSWVKPFMEGQAERENSTPVYGPEPDPRGNPMQKAYEPKTEGQDLNTLRNPGTLGVIKGRQYVDPRTLKSLPYHPYINPRTGELSRTRIPAWEYTLQNILDAKPFQTELPSWSQLKADRTGWQYLQDWGSGKAWSEWGRHVGNKFRHPVKTVKDFGKSILNEYATMPESFKSKVSYNGLGGMLPFAFLGAFDDEAYDSIRDSARYAALKDGVDPESHPYRYYFNYHLPEVGKEVFYRQVPNYITGLASFAVPDVEARFKTDIAVNMPTESVLDKKPLTGVRHADNKNNRIKSPQDIRHMKDELERIGKLIPGVIEDSEKYQGFNVYTDIIAPQLEFMTGGPLGVLAPRTFPAIARFAGNPNAVFYDKQGHPHYDLTEFGPSFFGVDKSKFEQLGGRPELREMSKDQVDNYVNWLKRKAAMRGYTIRALNKGETLLRHPKSNWFIDANRLELMGLEPKDIYGSPRLRDIEEEPMYAGKVMPKYRLGTSLPSEFHTYEYTNPTSPKYNPEVPPGTSDQDWDGRVDNVEYQRAKTKLDRERYDQETLFEISPFFQANRLKENQLSDEEETLLNDPKALEELLAVQAPDILYNLKEEDIPYVYLPEYREIKHPNGSIEQEQLYRADQRQLFIDAFVLNKLSSLPPQKRYAWLINNPDYIQPFLDTYYTNEETKTQLFAMLKNLVDKKNQRTYSRPAYDHTKDLPGYALLFSH